MRHPISITLTIFHLISTANPVKVIGNTLVCHICMGGEGTPCTEDPRSMQSLPCNTENAFILPEFLTKAVLHKNPAKNVVSCLAVAFRKQDRGLKSVRTCLKSAWNACRKLEGALLDSEKEFIRCWQCVENYCNRGSRLRDFKVVLELGIVWSSIYNKLL